MLSYDQPIGRTGAAETPLPLSRKAAGFSLFQLTQTLWDRKIAIATAGLICACAAIMIGKTLTPKYAATSQLYVDPRELQLVDRELTPRAQDISGLAMVVESQARLITSNNVLLQVIKDNNLDKDPEFGGESRGVLASVLSLFGLEVRSTGETKLGQTSALEVLNRHINVKKTDRSFIVDIEVWSYDPAKAAVLANAIATAYLAESKNSQATAARRATTDLSGRLKELQLRLRNAENALFDYKTKNNFVGTQDTAINDQQLSASNQRLANAHAQTLDAQAKFDQIEASRRTSADAGAIPEALQSPTIANLRAQYAEARKRYAEMMGEFGPLHPALRQMEKQVDDLRRTVSEEVDRFSQAAKNDLTRARDYEASLNKALEAQKRQSAQLSQASVRLRELERDVESSRDLYQSFLKRSRETEEQESLNTSSARIIGEASIPQRRTFPPAMSLLALIGFMFGALAAAAWAIAVNRISVEAFELPARSIVSEKRVPVVAEPVPQPRAPATLLEKPTIARLQEADIIRTLGGILSNGGISDVTRIGWPTLRAGFPLTAFLNAMREMRATLTKRAPAKTIPVMAVISTGASEDRSIAAVNVALAAARDGLKVLMIDAHYANPTLSNKVRNLGTSPGNASSWLGIGAKAATSIATLNGISILTAVKGIEAVCHTIAAARATGGYDLMIVDGPAMPASTADRKLFDMIDGLVAVLPARLDINDGMEDVIASLGGAERKLIGVILNELTPAPTSGQKDKQYA